MTSKKKLILAISSFSLVFVSVIVAVVAIFAAQRQGVQTTFRISYTAKNVAATVQANYTVGATTTAMHTDAGEEELVFLPEMAEGTGKLSPESDNIDMGDESVVYLEYIFANDSDTVDVAISLDTSAFELNNMRVSYAYSYSQITNYETMPTDDSFEPMMILGKTDENGDYATLYVYMKVEVFNLANDASFTGNIVYNLDRATPVKLEFKDFSSPENAVLMQRRYIPSGVNINDLPIPYDSTGTAGNVWLTRDLEPISFPINTTSDLNLLYVTYYSISTTDNGVNIRVNMGPNGPLYIKLPNGTSYSFGESVYTVTNGEYLRVCEQTVTIFMDKPSSGSFKIKDLVRAGIQISAGQPKDLEEKLFYAAYGAYPQTYVGDELNATLKSASLTATGKSYTTDVNGLEMELIEYSYNGKNYASFETYGLIYQTYLPNGVLIDIEERYFFFVEPIVAKSMQKNENGTYTMMSTRILGSRVFDSTKTVYFWEDSSLRNYLNTTFLQESGLSDFVVETQIKNNNAYNKGSWQDASSGYATIDNIWLASVEDYFNWYNYSGSLDDLSNYGHLTINDFGPVMPTDMSCATFASYDGGNFYSGWYYLRTGNTTKDCSCVFGYWEGVIGHTDPADISCGFCPVFAVNI